MASWHDVVHLQGAGWVREFAEQTARGRSHSRAAHGRGIVLREVWLGGRAARQAQSWERSARPAQLYLLRRKPLRLTPPNRR